MSTESYNPLDDRLENWTGLWYVRWPDGSISIAAAGSVDEAVDLFDRLGQIAPEMVRPWNNPQMLVDLNYNLDYANWDAIIDPDTDWSTFMDEIAPKIASAESEVSDKDLFHSMSGKTSQSGKRLLEKAFEEHSKETLEEYKVLASVHRSRCKDNYCPFCFDDRFDEGRSKEKSGIA